MKNDVITIRNKEDISRILKRATAVGVIGNIFLACFKLFAGIFGHSTAMVSDAVHSFSDVFATLIAFIGSRISAREVDKEHPYGHDRFECVASMLLAVILFATGAGIGISCVKSILSGAYLSGQQQGVIALAAAIVSIAAKEAMFWYTMIQAKKTNSSVFRADAWHHRSDALSSIGALIGIIGARMGYPIMDVLAGFVICIVIIVVSIGILKDALDKMLDRSASDEFEQQMRDCISQTIRSEGISIGIDSLLTREFGNSIYADVEICMDGNITLKESHDHAEAIHNKLEETFPQLKHVMVHVNPAGFKYTIR